jgi:hypothetical protein
MLCFYILEHSTITLANLAMLLYLPMVHLHKDLIVITTNQI